MESRHKDILLEIKLGDPQSALATARQCNIIPDLLKVPMKDEMIHYLPRENFSALSKFTQEAYQVLKQEDGVFVINTCIPEQSQRCWIGSSLAPNYIANRYSTIEELCSMLKEAGFKIGSVNIHKYQRLYKHEALDDPEGPLKREWRDLHSVWSYLSEKELEDAQEEWQRRRREGTLEELMRKREDMIRI